MIFFYISLSTYISFCILKYRKAFVILNKEKYSTKKYFKTIKENKTKLFITPELLIIGLIILALNTDVKTIAISTIILYAGLFLYELKQKRPKLKTNKKINIRILIICIIYILINIYFCLDYKEYHSAEIIFDNTPLYYIITVVISYLSYFIVGISNAVANIVEKIIKK